MHTINNQPFVFTETSENEVRRSIMLITSNVIGAGNISFKYLKIILPAVLPITMSIINFNQYALNVSTYLEISHSRLLNLLVRLIIEP